MARIETHTFDSKGIEQIKDHPLARDWPVVYVIEDSKEVYIGETTSALSRSKQHIKSENRARLHKIHLILDEEFNKSATLDLESQLIQYFAAEGSLKLQNGNNGLENHNYFDKARYRAKLADIWHQLQKVLHVSKDLEDIENSELFKYSPYKALTEDQIMVANELFDAVKVGENKTHIVNGGPGTGKTILATYLMKFIKTHKDTKDLSIGLVISMTSLRESIKQVFSHVQGLSADMVLGPSEVTTDAYDLLIVDEAHRLRQRKNIVNYGGHDRANRRLGLGNEGTELDWVLMKSKQQILFYDENQSIRPSDVVAHRFKNLSADHYHLTSQIRVKGGEKYIQFISDLFEGKKSLDASFENYDFQIYDNIAAMVQDIKKKDAEIGLGRLVAGFAWPWISRGKPDVHDIEIADTKLRWNSTTENWVNSKNAVNEVGCIHTVQGYDLNYAGVIVGPELTYDADNDCLRIDESQYADRNGRQGIDDPAELKRYIVNIYKTLMTRGMRGCYLYFVDKGTEQYFKSRLKANDATGESGLVISPITVEMVRVPILGTAPCGNPFYAEENTEGHVEVPKAKLRSGVKYFIVRAEGDSMNLAGIQDGDLLLCRFGEKGETGDRVVALLGGENVTIKEYGPRVDGVRLLLPKSTNKSHMPITPDEGDSVQGIVQEVLR